MPLVSGLSHQGGFSFSLPSSFFCVCRCFCFCFSVFLPVTYLHSLVQPNCSIFLVQPNCSTKLVFVLWSSQIVQPSQIVQFFSFAFRLAQGNIDTFPFYSDCLDPIHLRKNSDLSLSDAFLGFSHSQ